MTAQNSTSEIARASGPGGGAYMAARHAAAVFPRERQARLRLTGADRLAWLQGLVTNDVAALTTGRGCYAAYLTPQGRMISDLRVLALPDALLLDVPSRTVHVVRDRFELFVITEDVVVEDVTGAIGRFALHGPESARVLSDGLLARDGANGPADLRPRLVALGEHESLTVPLAGTGEAASAPVALIVAGARELGVTGFDLYAPPADLARLRDRLLEAGAAAGSDETWDTLRIEAGTPEFGRDMDENTIPLEAGIEQRAISFTKGCYVGQEVIVRVVHRGHGRVARRLVGLTMPSAGPSAGTATEAMPATGDLILAPGTGREAGHVTSAAWSPGLRQWIALAYVHRDLTDTGTPVGILHASERIAAVVTDLPFVK